MTPVWMIEWMQTTPTSANPSEAVLQVGWRCSGTEDNFSGSVYSTCTLPAADPASFVPYADLTQDQVLGWIWANGVNQAATEAAVAQQIDNQKNPPTIQPPLPWAA
jgi:hypothetical protein